MNPEKQGVTVRTKQKTEVKITEKKTNEFDLNLRMSGFPKQYYFVLELVFKDFIERSYENNPDNNGEICFEYNDSNKPIYELWHKLVSEIRATIHPDWAYGLELPKHQ